MIQSNASNDQINCNRSKEASSTRGRQRSEGARVACFCWLSDSMSFRFQSDPFREIQLTQKITSLINLNVFVVFCEFAIIRFFSFNLLIAEREYFCIQKVYPIPATPRSSNVVNSVRCSKT